MADIHTLIAQIDEQFADSKYYTKDRTFLETTDLIKCEVEAYAEDHTMIPLPSVMFDMFRSLLAHIEDLEDTLEVQDVTRIEGQ